MAGHVRKLGTGKWQSRWYEASGRERTKVFPRKSDAEKHLTFVNNALLSGTYIDATAGKVTLGVLAEQWFSGKVNLKATTRARVRSLLDVHVIPRWKDTPLVRVEHSAIQAWVRQLVASGQSPASVRKIHGVLSGVLAMAVKDRRLAANPCDGVNLPRVSSKPHLYLTAQQVAALADAGATPTGKSRGTRTAETFDQNRLIVLMLAYCGLRWGEMAALKVGSVDFLRRRLSISASVSDVDGQGLVWTTPKDHENRSVPVPTFLADELARHVAGKTRDDLLFVSHSGSPLSHRLERRAWFDGAASSIGVATLTLHDLRHTSASLAVSAGANVKAVQRMLGHAQASMTLDTYADLFDSDLDAVADRLDAVARAVFEAQTEFSRNPAPLAALPIGR